jgi:phosphoribosylamine--glycine ligase
MKVLVIGDGAADHALVWKLSQSRHINMVYCCPGNSVIAETAECIDVSPYNFRTLIDFVKYEWIDLTIVGSRKLFLKGIVNAFEKEGCRILGPQKAAAQCMTSRVFFKNLMRRYRITTPEYKVFSSYFQAQDYIRLKTPPFVIKTDDFHNHLGIFTAFTIEDAMNALKMIMEDRIFGDAGKNVIVEESLQGNRVSFLTVTDGQTIVPLTDLYTYKDVSKDKRRPIATVTGAYSPTGVISEELTNTIMLQIMEPLLMALKSEGIHYKGLLFADLIYARERPYVFELQCCFPDPETQTILPRLKSDLVDLAFSVIEERLSDMTIELRQEASVCIVVSSANHVREDQKRVLIDELDKMKSFNDVAVFYGGASLIDKNTVSADEMIMCITALGNDVTEAKNKAYDALDKLNLDGMYYKKDIANK